MGRDVYFAAGRYAPGTAAGRGLLAHEAVHVAQQTGTTLRRSGAPVPVSRTGGPAVQLQPGPGKQVLDAAYGLYTSGQGTNFEGASGDYTLSPWDMGHLVRSRGFYFFTASKATGKKLIMPPEVRKGHGNAVLVEVTADEDKAFATAADPAAWVRALARTKRSVDVPSVTASTLPDRDFIQPELPASVRAALAAAPASDAVATAASARAAGIPQATTISMAEPAGVELPTQKLTEMDVGTLSRMSDAARANWYLDRLGAFQAQLLESAKSHKIPMQLLATIILNELGDINWIDIFQQGAIAGSLGIAQMQVSTAVKYGHVTTTQSGGREAAERWLTASGRHMHGEVPPEVGKVVMTAQRLEIAQYSLEAAAREIERLLTLMAANTSLPWQQQNNFVASGPEGDAIYGHVGAGPPLQREMTLAEMVAAAYNSPDIVITHTLSIYKNATIHGGNAAWIAGELYRLRIFRTT